MKAYRAIFAVAAVCALSACGSGHKEPDADTTYVPVLTMPEPAMNETAPEKKAPTTTDKYKEAYDLERRDTGPASAYSFEETPLEKAFALYLQVVPSMPEARVDLTRAHGRLLEQLTLERFKSAWWGDRTSSPEFVNLLLKAWDERTVDRKLLQPLMLRTRARLEKLSKAEGFNPDRRYNPKSQSDSNLFFCSGFGSEADVISRMYQQLDPGSPAAKKWKLQSLDRYQLVGCESDGEFSEEYGTWANLYEGYRSIGYPADAQKWAEAIVKGRLTEFAEGINGSHRTASGDPEDLKEAKKWLAKFPASTQNALLRKYAKKAEQAHHYRAASMLYAEAGDALNAKRMKTLGS